MVRCKFLIILIIISTRLPAQTYPDYMVNYLLKAGIDNILSQNYDQALEKFIRLENDFPAIPLGKIFQSAVLITKAVDYNNFEDDRKIRQLLDKAEEQADSLLDISDSNVWNHYYKALAVGYQAYFSALKSDYFDAFSTALTSLEHFEICLEIDSLFYESYTALGSYFYWKSAKTEFLNWLPFFEDDTENGINYLKEAVENSVYHKHLAANSLIWIYIDRGKYDKAVSLAEMFLKKYPNSRFFLEGAARAYEEIEKEKAIEYYQQMLKSLPANIPSIVINRVILLHKIAMQYEKLDDKQKVLALCDEILSIKIDDEYISKLEGRLDRVEQLKKRFADND
ncbi:MAG: tetratricopeptide repeat protein [Melioribacteraceae bacterium]|nr:tetratricopeptide repeat protein [Melioribacteraceae bacterium]MDD3559786.1 tetratricopeptide repeat protein [Melioribacteraceae bacterium]